VVLYVCMIIFTGASSGCAAHSVVPVHIRYGSETGQVAQCFGVTQNGVIIPEYSVDAIGRYPATPGEARIRFTTRRVRMEKDVDKKYKIPNNVIYQAERWGAFIGLCAVSPVVLPLMYVSEQFTDSDDQRHNGSLLLMTKRYFAMSLNDPAYKEPLIRDPMTIINIP